MRSLQNLLCCLNVDSGLVFGSRIILGENILITFFDESIVEPIEFSFFLGDAMALFALCRTDIIVALVFFFMA
jgi:hypothetical protein